MRPLMFLVGRNGSGKSNFLDALRFVADGLNSSLDHALRERGGIKEVRRRSGGHPTHFGMRLEFFLVSGASGHYAFRVGARPHGGYEVQQEECRVDGPHALQAAFYRVEGGDLLRKSFPVAPALLRDRLYLGNAAGLPEFRPVYDALTRMCFYNLSPDRMRELQSPDAAELLARDGSNLASVLARMSANGSRANTRVEEYLAAVAPGVEGVDAKSIGPKETIEFRQQMAGSPDPWRFPAANMSDGTVRALGILVALFQPGSGCAGPSLVGIEEPEAALHPAAVGALLDSLREASRTTQVMVTSHSPDLLDDDEIETSALVAVTAEGGVATLAPIDDAGRSALRDRLYTAGELLRQNQLRPDPAAARLSPGQLSLFGEAPA